jgi:hypothetical protein
MKRIKQPSHAISGVFVFLLLGIFAVFSTVMVLMGAKAYKGTAERAAEHNEKRLAQAYVRSMVRSDDEKGGVRVEEVSVPVYTASAEEEETDEDADAEGFELEETAPYDGETVTIPAITMESDYAGEKYVTRIYVYGGMLREWNASEEVDFDAANGEAVCAADEMTARMEDGVLSVRIRSGETWTQADIALRTAR